MNEGHPKFIGIVLCASKNESVVKYTLPEDNQQIFTSAYQMYLPSVEELEDELTARCQVLMNSNEIDI